MATKKSLGDKIQEAIDKLAGTELADFYEDLVRNATDQMETLADNAKKADRRPEMKIRSVASMVSPPEAVVQDPQEEDFAALLQAVQETFSQQNLQGFNQDIIQPIGDEVGEFFTGTGVPEVGGDPVVPDSDILAQLQAFQQMVQEASTPEANKARREALAQPFLDFQSRVREASTPEANAQRRQDIGEFFTGEEEVPALPNPQAIMENQPEGNILDDLLALFQGNPNEAPLQDFVQPSSGPIPDQPLEEDFALDTADPSFPDAEEPAEFIPEPEVELPLDTMIEAGANDTSRERNHLIDKSLAGLATRSDMIRYMDLSEELGEAPNFTDFKDGSGFFVQSEAPGQLAPPSTSGLSSIDTLRSLQKYQGDLMAEQTRIVSEAEKLATRTNEVLADMRDTFAEMEASSDPLVQQLGRQRLGALQAELAVAQKEDEAAVEQFKLEQGVQVQQELDRLTGQLKLAEFEAQQEAINSRKPKVLTPEMSAAVSTIYGTEDPATTWANLPAQLQGQVMLTIQEVQSTPYAMGLATSPDSQDKMEQLYSNIVYPNQPDKQAVMDLIKKRKLKAIKIGSANAKKDTRYETLPPDDQELLTRREIQSEMLTQRQKFGQDTMATTLDWYAIPSIPLTGKIIEQLRTEKINSWDDVVTRIPEIAEELSSGVPVTSIVNRMFEGFQQRYDREFGEFGMSFDMSSMFERAQEANTKSFLDSVLPNLRFRGAQVPQ